MNRLKVIILIFFLVFSITISPVYAAVPTNNVLEGVQYLYRDAATSWSPILQGYAERIFWILALIDFVWMAIILALNQGTFSDLVASVIRKIFFIGFFWALLINGTAWATSIVQSLVRAGARANTIAGGTSAISPSTMFDIGYDMCARIAYQMSALSPIDSLGLLICAIIIMIVFALIAAMMLLVYVQSYIIIYAGVIFLGMGGSLFTKDIALNYIRGALSVGAKLFVMILIVGLGQTILNSWLTDFQIGIRQIVIFLGASIVLLALVKEVPNMVADLINGFSWGSGDSLFRTSARLGKMAVGAAIGATAGGVGASMAVSEASKLSGASSSGGFASKMVNTAKNLGRAAARDTAGKISGQHWGQGTKGGRMAADLKTSRLSTDSLSSGKKKENSDQQQFSPEKLEKDD